MTAKEIAPYSSLDKMQVSRAAARLEARGLVCRDEDTSDHRTRILTLKDAGRQLYQKIAPLALAREAFILEALDPEERSRLDRILKKIGSRTEEIVARGWDERNKSGC